MLEFFQEATLPKLSETDLYQRFNQTSKIGSNVISEIKNSKETTVNPEDLKEVVALIRLNGTVVAKRAVDAFLSGKIVIIYNKATSKIPETLPYIVIGKEGKYTAYIFADKFMNKINASSEYTKLMAVMEAAYVSLQFNNNSTKFVMNSEMMLTLCNLYTMMVCAPIEQRLYVKGENLNKAMLYTIAHFYNVVRGNEITETSIPIKRLMKDKIDPNIAKQIVSEVVANDDKSLMGLIRMITKINPVRYASLEETYLRYFITSCGSNIMFALEYIPCLFLLVSSATYKTALTPVSLNNLVSAPCKKAELILANITNEGGDSDARTIQRSTNDSWKSRASAAV